MKVLDNTAMPGFAAAFAAALLAAGSLRAQWWDAAAECANMASEQTNGRFTASFEFRTRFEDKTGVGFGKDPDLSYGLIRTRFGLAYKPVTWLKVSGMVQDSRAPEYGNNAPSTVRDPADLQEAYVELFPDEKTGFGMTTGRKMLSYGEGRLIGIPDWTNLSRTYDHARAYYRFQRARLEMLYLSPVKINLNGFNSPVLGNHIWGTYDVFPNLFGKNSLDTYVLRRDQNRPGGFTGGKRADGTDRLGITTYGFRMAGPVAFGVQYSMEGALQNGEVGPATQNGSAWFSGLKRRYHIDGMSLDVSGEYKIRFRHERPKKCRPCGYLRSIVCCQPRQVRRRRLVRMAQHEQSAVTRDSRPDQGFGLEFHVQRHLAGRRTRCAV